MVSVPIGTSTPASLWRSLRRLLVVLSIFVLGGPPIAAVSLVLAFGLWMGSRLGHMPSLVEMAWLVVGSLGMMWFAVLMSYSVAGVSAGLAGVISGLYVAWKRTLPLWLAVGAGVAGAILPMAWTGPPKMGFPVYLGIMVCSSAVCWLVLRRNRFV